MMDIKQLAKDFVISYFGVREDLFNTAWDVVSANYESITPPTVSGMDFRQLGSPLGIARAEESEAIKVVIVFVSADKQASFTSAPHELIALFQSQCEKFLEQESKKLTQAILDSVRKSILEFLKNDDDTVHIVPYAMMWTNKIKPEGEIIDKREFDEYEANKDAYKIFIIDRGEFELDSIGEVYLNQGNVSSHAGQKNLPPSEEGNADSYKKNHLTPLEYRLLVYILKNAGREDTRYIFDLIRHCWRNPTDADEVYSKIKEGKADYARELASKHRKKVAELSAFLNAKLGIGLQTSGTGKYHLTTYPSFCVLELLKQEL